MDKAAKVPTPAWSCPSILITDPVDSEYGGFPWLYGDAYGKAYSASTGNLAVGLSWNGKVVEYWAIFSRNAPDQQLNVKDRECHYFAIGIQE